MSDNLLQLQTDFCNSFNEKSVVYFKSLQTKLPQVQILWESMQYSFNTGGKRFRPFLVHLVSESFNLKNFSSTIFYYALAVEMIHTYSLIHDDLPCMDNDDLRRGKPTNHKVYGEDIALLAGDALLTQAMTLISKEYAQDPSVALKLIHLLSDQSGPAGMIGGQVLDIKSTAGLASDHLALMHKLKTGALIEAAVSGAALIMTTDSPTLEKFKIYGQSLGLAFQIKDDILDAHEKDQDYKNYVFQFGLEKTLKELSIQSKNAEEALKSLAHLQTDYLCQLIYYNENRKS